MSETLTLDRPGEPHTRRPLVVDLDGTLLKGDLLFECLFTSISASPARALQALFAGRASRSRLKVTLERAARLEVSSLPYREEVLALIRRRRRAGDRIVLCTAAAQALAERIAAHLGLFDEVFGSDETLNLKGANKARFLAERFGIRGFDYVGDSAADLPVWDVAGAALVTAASERTISALGARGGEISHIAARDNRARAAIRAMRPHQWSKNVLIFLPLLAAHAVSMDVILPTLAIFVAFCCVASGIYLVNDLLDLAADRAHPRKRARPLASGHLPLVHASGLAAVLILAGTAIALVLGPGAVLVTLGYLALTTGYSLFLKRKIVLDVCVLAGLYTVRILAGIVVTGLPTSVWLLGFSVFFFFGLAAVKRLAEIAVKAGGSPGALTGRAYEAMDAGIVSSMAIASNYAAILIFALYLNSEVVTQIYRTPAALWLVCPVLLYWTSRTVIIAHRGLMEDDPVIFAFRDKVSRACFALIGVILLAASLADFGSLLRTIYSIS